MEHPADHPHPPNSSGDGSSPCGSALTLSLLLRGWHHFNERLGELLELAREGYRWTYVAVELFHLFRFIDEQSFRYDNCGIADAGHYLNLLSQVTGTHRGAGVGGHELKGKRPVIEGPKVRLSGDRGWGSGSLRLLRRFNRRWISECGTAEFSSESRLPSLSLGQVWANCTITDLPPIVTPLRGGGSRMICFHMPNDAVTQYNVDALVSARKTAMKTKINTLYLSDPKQALTERCLKVDVRRADSTALDLSLEFYPRVMIRELAGVRTVQRPSASLMWKGKRIRGLDYSLKHDVIKDGVIINYIKGWHEHYWTDLDEDSSIRTPNPSLQNHDLQSVIVWCCKKWNIEGLDTQAGLYE